MHEQHTYHMATRTTGAIAIHPMENTQGRTVLLVWQKYSTSKQDDWREWMHNSVTCQWS